MSCEKNNRLQEEMVKVVAAALDLLDKTNSTPFKLPIPHTQPRMFIVVGDLEQIRELARDDETLH